MTISTNFFLCLVAAVLLGQSLARAQRDGESNGDGGDGGSGYDGTGEEGTTETMFLFVLGGVSYYLFDCCIRSVANDKWSRKIEQARAEILQDAAENTSAENTSQPPFSTANFFASYSDTTYWIRQTVEGILVLRGPETHTWSRWTLFGRRDTQVACHAISGSGTDGYRNFSIDTGLWSPQTGKCFWVQVEDTTSREGSPKQQKIVSGTLTWLPDVEEAVFGGHWVAQNSEAGFFTSFRIVPWSTVNRNNRNNGNNEVVSAISMPSVDAVPVDSDCESVVQVEVKAVDVLSRGYNVHNQAGTTTAAATETETATALVDRNFMIASTTAATATARLEASLDDHEPIPDDEEAPIHSPVQQGSPVVNVRMGYNDPVW